MLPADKRKSNIAFAVTFHSTLARSVCPAINILRVYKGYSGRLAICLSTERWSCRLVRMLLLARGTVLPRSMLMQDIDCRGMKREDVSRPVSMEDFHQVRRVLSRGTAEKEMFIW